MTHYDFINEVMRSHCECFGYCKPKYVQTFVYAKDDSEWIGFVVDYHFGYMCITEANMLEGLPCPKIKLDHTGYSYESISDFSVKPKDEFCEATFMCGGKPIMIKLPAGQMNMLLGMQQEIETRKHMIKDEIDE